MPKNGKYLYILIIAIAVIAAVMPMNASAQSTHTQVQEQIRTQKLKAHKSRSVVNFFHHKGRHALYLQHKKCPAISAPKAHKTCIKARQALAFHAKRLKKIERKLAMLSQPRDTGYLPPTQARELGQKMAALRGWVGEQWVCLDKLWGHLESAWEPHKYNLAGSGAYGIPQAYPGDKMSSAGRNWRDSAYVQIKWGLGYIAGKFKTPCKALTYHYAHNSY